jgi:hypothetical protein
VKGEGLKGTAVDEGCSRVMKDRAKWMEGEMELTEPSKPDVFITGAMPNKQLKKQVTYDYRTPTPVDPIEPIHPIDVPKEITVGCVIAQYVLSQSPRQVNARLV